MKGDKIMAHRQYVKLIFKDGSVREYHNVYIKETSHGFRISHNQNYSDEDFIPFNSLNNSACRKANPNEGCFISTAVYQFHINPEINLNILKDFRDDTMRTKSLTNKLIDIYYDVSPPIAKYLSTNKNQSEFIKTFFIDTSVNLIQKMNYAKMNGHKFISYFYEMSIYVIYSIGLLTSWILFKISR